MSSNNSFLVAENKEERFGSISSDLVESEEHFLNQNKLAPWK
jgi:hypothetical protein